VLSARIAYKNNAFTKKKRRPQSQSALVGLILVGLILAALDVHVGLVAVAAGVVVVRLDGESAPLGRLHLVELDAVATRWAVMVTAG
jgi:hypothetical protein